MAELIDALPGIALPVEEVTRRLDTMWAGDTSEHSPSEFRASQMNVVLHFGKETTPGFARSRFDGLIRFAQRYPSRIIVLCPSDSGNGMMKAKLFSQCYIGSNHREMCCCEALLLGYQPEDGGYLSNQVSTWLESDLPTYHWFCGVPVPRIEGYFDNLLSGVRRCIYDSSIEPEDMVNLDWPQPNRVRDLAAARILPVRQLIGQFLSGYAMDTLCRGLGEVTVRHAHGFRGEAYALREWIASCFKKHFSKQAVGEALPSISVEASEEGDVCLSMQWSFSNDNRLHWTMHENEARGVIETCFDSRSERMPAHTRLLPLEKALAEALFF